MGSRQSQIIETPHRFGWIRDLPDRRDHKRHYHVKDHPATFALEISQVPVMNQGNLGSCTANAIACAYQYDEEKQKASDESRPSRLFIYYNERAMEGTISSDSGAQIRDGIKSINNVGVCSETLWPYDISKFTQKPYPKCYEAAKDNHAVEYGRVQQTEDQLKAALKNGFPVVFGVSVYQSFESTEAAKTGTIPMPQDDEKLLGGHAITLYGWDDGSKRFLFRNSWGTEWGSQGNGTLPYEYVLSPELASDFWTITKIVETPPSPQGLEAPPPSPSHEEVEEHLGHLTAEVNEDQLKCPLSPPGDPTSEHRIEQVEVV
jgi:C1A family cysteine protease